MIIIENKITSKFSAQHFNKSYVTKFGNGGNNNDIVDILQNFGCHFVDIRGIDYFVIQFTDFVRDPYFSFTKYNS